MGFVLAYAEEISQQIFTTVFNGQWNPKSVGPGGSSNGPALAFGNGMFLMVWKGIDTDTRLWWSMSTDGKTWTQQQVVTWGGSQTPIQSEYSPALAYLGNHFVMAWKGLGEVNSIFRIGFSGGTWGAPDMTPAATTSRNPGFAAVPNQVNTYAMAWRGIEGDTNNYTVIGNEALLAVGNTSHSPALAFFAGQAFLAYKGIPGDPGMYWASTPNESNFTGQTQQNAPGGTSHGPALAADANGLMMVWKGPPGDPRIFSAQNPTGTAFLTQSPPILDLVTSVSPGLCSF